MKRDIRCSLVHDWNKNGPSRTEPPSASYIPPHLGSWTKDLCLLILQLWLCWTDPPSSREDKCLIVALMTKFNVWSGGSRNILIEEGSWNIPHVSECRFVWEPWGFRYNGGRFRDMPAPLSSSPATAASAEGRLSLMLSKTRKSKFGIFISPYRQIHGYFTYLLQKHL